MSKPIRNRAHWRAVLQQQRRQNIEYWLAQLEGAASPANLIAGDYDNLLRALETALESVEFFDLGYRLIQGMFSAVFGYADWDRWLTYLWQAWELANEGKRPFAAARLLEQIGDVYYHLGRLQDASEQYARALEQYQTMQKLSDYSRLLAKTALVDSLQGKTTESIALCRQAIEIASSLQATDIIAHAHLNLSHIYKRTRNWRDGLKAAQKAHRLYRELNQPAFATKALMNMVAFWAELGEWEQVDAASSDLMADLISLGDVQTLSQLKNNLGVVAFNQANYKAAEAAWQEALRLHSQIQEPSEVAGLYNNLGMVYTRMKEWQAAEEMLLQAVAAYERLGDVYNWANSMDNLAELYEALGENGRSRQILQEAIQGLQALPPTKHSKLLLNTMKNRLQSLS
ncbi:MAG: tetratricopeptide repeat protein [Chloroflexi bacterium]|nr:MAG: tetratricopeptide repeat protein [Chloroflexota bacterium]